MIEIIRAQLKLLLGLLLIEVRGLDFIHNLLVIVSSLIFLHKCLFVKNDYYDFN